ncbi:MAG: STAS domain-containing protein [Syntrophaceae bacterium]|jgi:anti-anti-sigma factor
MQLAYIDHGDVRVYFPEGRLDHSQSLVVENKLNSAINEGISKLIFDLSKLDYLSSSGLRVFISLIKQVHEKKGRIVFCSLSPSVANLIEMVALQNDLEIFPTLFEALLSFEPEREK